MAKTGRKKLFHTKLEDVTSFVPGTPIAEDTERKFRRYHGGLLISLKKEENREGKEIRGMNADQVVVHIGKAGEGRQEIAIGKREGGS